jgi:arylsulfatase A-like enzyme
MHAGRKLDDSLVVLTSDHGEAFGERQLFGHQVSVYQDQVHVPLLVKFPRQREGRIVDDPVSLTDVFPTVLEQTGLRIPTGLDGLSLLRGAADPSREIVSESFSSYYLAKWHERFRRVERALFDWPLKLVVSTDGRREVYDLDADPGEMQNLYRDSTSFPALEERLDVWLRSLRAAPGEPRAPLDKATEESLRALGYL